ncbi:MAG: hypothetical protein LBU84_18505 [Prevotella sp.]|jgi:hypothetical protein|nr:hypothetical protein [Prevotella sp.]
MKQPLIFPHKVLFIEFFIREYRFYGKGTVRTTLPHDAFFYTGPSKAQGFLVPYIAYDSGKPFLSESIPDELCSKLFKDNTNVVCSVTGEYPDKNNVWHKGYEKLSSNKTGMQGNQGQLPYVNFKSIAPYGFNLLDVNPETGDVTTDFPRNNIILDIKTGQTLCFLCRCEERGDGEWYTPNVNLVLFVKNYGLHDHIRFLSQKDINRIAEKQLCDEKFALRDFRKSSLDFELG